MHRSHHAIEPKNIVVCTTTGEFMLPHNIAIDGSYNGKCVFIKQNLKQRYEHLIKSPEPLKRSKKLYGIVELEIEVTELLENISIALCHLQKLDLLSATNYELRIFQKDIATLTDAVINLKCKIQKTFKNITFQEDIQCLASSKEISRDMNSREVIDKTGHSIREPKELDETQNEFRSFHHRLAAGSSVIASEKKHSLITKEIKKKTRPEEKKEKPRRIHADNFEDIIKDSGYNHSESKQSWRKKRMRRLKRKRRQAKK
uniref:Uncharacterized protein n=1 Tax=Onchocerca volvulus TaxID=6282 RepID=A0A8R1XXK7_ONCVO